IAYLPYFSAHAIAFLQYFLVIAVRCLNLLSCSAPVTVPPVLCVIHNNAHLISHMEVNIRYLVNNLQ
ncbi:hypothetical protein, partial [Sphingobacterium sp. UBA2480]|uniref:hypothetical protein n=1 Tax=Sphingobacterium sp. UBA2480 TaxID=1947489 RepID=UPI00257D961F